MLTTEEKIAAVFGWFEHVRAGARFIIRSDVELQTGIENHAFTQIVRNLPHIRAMVNSGWIELDGRIATLTEAGQFEMRRRGH
ncbi:hypothetical protein [Cupriavidus sp. IK-TO18]|uniref:hypothetical protein n=1 Tax=Cupriavidus sp. IK-TO18 TaxID=2782182 RepID=UPI00189702F0|nr:hypothetical protein [Cupriavidus sp. IK-TO18]MBF6989288.1 hypothetical protein [Cupriavidus sp. IK-TO18]